MLSIKLLTTDSRNIKSRLRETAIKYSVIFGIAFLYLIFVLITDVRIPCPVFMLTGLKCPGCGITRLLVSVARFDFASAFWLNPFLFVTGPFIVAAIVHSEVRYVLCGSRQIGKWKIFLWVELALAITYGILRNIFPI